jgi:LPPG:FO 2-phospho-L-lactate transferase
VNIALLSGGTGGAKLARGLYELLGTQLSVIANTGDDTEIHGAYVSPDPDLITFWLADRIDPERGWGLEGDTFAAMEMLRALGRDTSFSLGDRDLALCLERRRLLEEGATLSEAHARIAQALGVEAAVIPMSDDRVRTKVRSGERVLTLHEFLIGERGAAPIDDVVFEGASTAGGAPAALAALADADAIVIGPSNPVLSIGPILAVAAIRGAIEAAEVPVIAVSPFVGGEVLKGPTAACLAWAGRSTDTAGVAAHYAGLIGAMVADEAVAGLRVLECDTWMGAASARRELAENVLALASELSG